MKHWLLTKPKKMTKDPYKDPKVEIEYDDIVDDSNYVQDKETVRNKRLNAGDAGGAVGIYDTKMPTDTEIALRNGKLDKAEVSQMMLQEQKDIKERAKDRKKAATEAVRQAAIDNAIGLTGEQEKAH